MKDREYFKRMRESSNELFKYSLHDAAQLNGLAIEYWEDMPAHFKGHLDEYEKPRFIAVNPDLPKQEQAYVIARELARFFQLCGYNSYIINQPWKLRLLATAPTQDRDYINRLDREVFAYWVMYRHATNDDFFGFIKSHRKWTLTVIYAHTISRFLFKKLRIRNFLYGILSIFRLVENKLIGPVL